MSGTTNSYNDEEPDYEAFLERAREEMLPKLNDSVMAIMVCPLDPKEIRMEFALELGCAILLDKPIILIVPSGTKVPDHIVRVSDEIVEMDLKQPFEKSKAVQDAILRVTERFNINRGENKK